jgi:hypothetical protein
LTADVHVTVLAGPTLAIGTEQWSISATPGYYVAQTMKGMPGMNGTTYLLEKPLDGSGSLLRVIDDDGNVQWSAPTPIGATEDATIAMGDSLGGVLLNVADSSNGGTGSVVRLGADGSQSWRHDSVYAQAQTGTGTIYAFASPDDGQLVILDGETGVERARVALARSSSTRYLLDDPGEVRYESGPGRADKLVTDASGNARFTLATSDEYIQYQPTFIFRAASKFELWTVTPTGGVSIATLASDVVPDGVLRSAKTYDSNPQLIIPDDNDIALVMWADQWRDDTGGSSVYHYDRHFARVPTGGGAASVMPVPDDVQYVQGAMGEENTLFTSDGSATVWALDATSGALKWSAAAQNIVATTAGGGIVVQAYDGPENATEDVYDHSGVLVSSVSTALGTAGQLTNNIVSVTSATRAVIDYSNAGWNSPNGSLLGGLAPPVCIPPLNKYRLRPGSTKVHFYLSYETGTFGMTGQEQAAVLAQAQQWTLPTVGYDYNIDSADDNKPSNTIVKKGRFDTPASGGVYEGEAVFDKDLASWGEEPRFGIQDNKWGIVINFNLRLALDEHMFKAAALHESGHLIGLGHVPLGCGFEQSIMTLTIDPHKSPLSPTANDVEGVGLILHYRYR